LLPHGPFRPTGTVPIAVVSRLFVQRIANSVYSIKEISVFCKKFLDYANIQAFAPVSP